MRVENHTSFFGKRQSIYASALPFSPHILLDFSAFFVKICPLERKIIHLYAIVLLFCTEALTGMIIDYFRSDESLDREAVLQNILLICRTSVPNILSKKTKESR